MTANSSLDPIRFRKDFRYSKRVPTLVCDSVSSSSEMARWVLDIHQIQHIEKHYPPPVSQRKVNRLSGNSGDESNPVLLTTDALVYTAESIIQHLDRHVPFDKKLFPTEPESQAEVVKWFKRCAYDLEEAVRQYVYILLFENRSDALKLFRDKATFGQKLGWTFLYWFRKRKLIRQYGLEGKAPVDFLVKISAIFDEVNQCLSDGRPYLCGDRFTAADLAFAAAAAPVLAPEEFGGAISKINQMPDELRLQIIEFRATLAGQFGLKVYQQDRPINLDLGPLPKEPGFLAKLLNPIITKLTGNQWKLFYMLQKRFPVISIGLAKVTIVSRHDLVVEALHRDEDFTIWEINAQKMANQNGTFFLGMDRSDPQFDRERNFVRAATHREDLERIRAYMRTHSDATLQSLKPFGKLDVVQNLNYPVLVGLMDDYFGVPAPVATQYEGWQRSMFYDLFLNLTNNEEDHAKAVKSAKERTAWVLGLIAKNKQTLEAGGEISDNILNRLIKLAALPENQWADDNVLRRNIGGLLTGIQETTSKAVIFVLQELFKRPDQLKGAIAAAHEPGIPRMLGYVYEGLRFSPVQPGVLRFSENEQYLKGSNGHSYTIKGDRKMLLLTSGAMFDPVTFPKPKQFNPERDARYMNWGFGLHECYGKYINMVTIPELVAAVLRLPNVRPAKGLVGQGAGLKDGPFPNNYVVQFDA